VNNNTAVYKEYITVHQYLQVILKAC